MSDKRLLCVRGRDVSGKWSWCACMSGKRDVGDWSQETECGMVVLLPGGRDVREPDCPRCIAALVSRNG